MIYIIGKFVCSILVFLLHPFNLKGAENIPRYGRAIIISNHQSNWDPIIVAMITYRFVHWLGKIELFQNKLLAWFFKSVNVIPVDRENVKPRTLIDCMKLLKNDKVLGIFPEGTRVKGEGNDIADGFVLFAIRTKSPIIPVHINGNSKPWGKLSLTVGEPIVLEEEFKKNVRDIDTATIANNIMNDLYKL